MRRLNIAMLSQTAQAETETHTQAALDVVGQQVEDDLLQVNQAQVDIDNHQAAIDDAEEVVQQAHEEHQVMQKAQLEGGAQQAAMESLKRFMVRAENRIGVPSSISTMSMEGFSDRSKRARVTMEAMSGVGDFIRKTLDMLKSAAIAVWEKVKDLYKKVSNAFGKLVERARALGASAKSYFGKKAPADTEITTDSVNAVTQVDGKRAEGKTFVQKLSEAFSKEGVGKAYESVKQFLKNRALYKKLVEYMGKGDKTKVAEAIAEMAPQADKTEDGVGVVTTPSLLGNFRLKITTFAQNSYDYIKEKAGSVRGLFSKEDKPELTTGVAPLTPEECEQVTKIIEVSAADAKQMKETQAEFEKAVKEYEAVTAPSTTSEDAADTTRTGGSAFRALLNSMMATMSAASTYMANTMKAALDYVSESIKTVAGKVTGKGKQQVPAAA